jgi:aminoglycoside N3'-acetyltransferase
MEVERRPRDNVPARTGRAARARACSITPSWKSSLCWRAKLVRVGLVPKAMKAVHVSSIMCAFKLAHDADVGTQLSALRSAKRIFKSQLKILRQKYARQFHAFSPEDLGRALRDLGLREGDVVLMHSAFDAFVGFTGRPTDVITVVQGIVSTRGVLMMPTIPFTGTAVDHVASHPVFDVARTPSRMGLLTELFRRTPGVVRSVHPTHAVAVWGSDAETIAAGHHTAATPCGAASPYAKLFDRNGKVLLAGVDIASCTLYHAIEEALGPRLPVSPFTEEYFKLRSRTSDGTEVVTTTRLFEPIVSRRRNLRKLSAELERIGAWHERRVGSLPLIVLDARTISDAAFALAERGIYCYD